MFLGACAADADPVLLSERPTPLERIAIDGGSVYAFGERIESISLADGELDDLGPFGETPVEIVVSEGHVYWAGYSGGIRRIGAGGQFESFGESPWSIKGDHGCAVFVATGGVFRLCPEDAAPVLVDANAWGPIALDESGLYANVQGALVRIDRTGGREVINAAFSCWPCEYGEPRPSELVVDGGVAYWLVDGNELVMQSPGGSPIRRGEMLRNLDGGETYYEDRLAVVDGTAYRGPIRLRPDSSEVDIWIPTHLSDLHSRVVGDGVIAWIDDGDGSGGSIYVMPLD